MAKGDHTHGDSAKRDETIVIDRDVDKIVITIELKERSEPGEGKNGGHPRKGPTATPFLLIPDEPGDSGVRPLPIGQALASQGIQASITNPDAAGGWADFDIELSCTVANLGAVASAATIVEFYIGDEFGIWNPSHNTLTPAQIKANAQLVGRTAVNVPLGHSATIRCPAPWKPGSPEAARKGVLAQVSDLFTDPVTAPFDGIGDRHVARNDGLMDPIIRSVKVTGTLRQAGPKPTGSYFQSLAFTNAGTGQKFSATVNGDQYAILLPNDASYAVTVTWVLVAGVANFGPQTEAVGNLNLSLNAQTYNYDIAW